MYKHFLPLLIIRKLAPHLEKTLNILFLSAWYPHRYDAMAGLFVRKHAEAVARHARVCVLFPYADNKIDHVEIVEQVTNGVTEIYVYYPTHSKLGTIINTIRAYRIGLKFAFSQWGKPDLTHANVFCTTAIVGYALKIARHIPYVITEHWSGYLANNGSYAKSGKIHQWLTRFLARQATCVMPVSGQLQAAMQANGIVANYHVVPNVVDDFFYQKQIAEPRQKKRILHISCFDEKVKNIKGLLQATATVSQQRSDFELIIVGTGSDFDVVHNYAQTLNLPRNVVHFVGEQTPQQVCKWFYQSDFFLLFSNYETAGVVLQESWTCGKPILSTPVGIMLDVEIEKVGKSTPIGDEKALEQNMNWMLDHFQEFDAEAMRQASGHFTFEAIGTTFIDIYRAAMQ